MATSNFGGKRKHSDCVELTLSEDNQDQSLKASHGITDAKMAAGTKGKDGGIVYHRGTGCSFFSSKPKVAKPTGDDQDMAPAIQVQPKGKEVRQPAREVVPDGQEVVPPLSPPGGHVEGGITSTISIADRASVSAVSKDLRIVFDGASDEPFEAWLSAVTPSKVGRILHPTHVD